MTNTNTTPEPLPEDIFDTMESLTLELAKDMAQDLAIGFLEWYRDLVTREPHWARDSAQRVTAEWIRVTAPETTGPELVRSLFAITGLHL